MHERNLYIERITPLLNTPAIRVITGMRRVGKSCLLKLVIERLRAENVKAQQIVYINKESMDYDFIRFLSANLAIRESTLSKITLKTTGVSPWKKAFKNSHYI